MSGYDLFTGPAQYISDPVNYAWKIIRESNALVDSVLFIEKQLAQTFKSTEIKSYIERNNQLIQTYADHYVFAYDQVLNGMVQRRLKR
ncbi:hypothetical protein [Sphingobacterium composti Ten et al. 2007 non Yoo et al. 2007]|uniref:hypothetical protein n=1 Tax=Sphingobacterium composti TaxID=363260 RepID=UPI00135786E4|nr:hypothetical protein [Sphingobacterium composti Ten et al. 2007 non Yoo et al. 2007]